MSEFRNYIKQDQLNERGGLSSMVDKQLDKVVEDLFKTLPSDAQNGKKVADSVGPEIYQLLLGITKEAEIKKEAEKRLKISEDDGNYDDAEAWEEILDNTKEMAAFFKSWDKIKEILKIKNILDKTKKDISRVVK